MSRSNRERGIVRSAAITVLILVPVWAVEYGPGALLGFAVYELIERRWLTGALLAGCSVVAFPVCRIVARRFVRSAENRDRPADGESRERP